MDPVSSLVRAFKALGGTEDQLHELLTQSSCAPQIDSDFLKAVGIKTDENARDN